MTSGGGLIRGWQAFVGTFATLALGEGVARAFGFVAVVVMARELEPDGFGLVTLGTSLVLWMTLVVDSGTEVLTTREVARHPDRLRELVEPTLGLRLALSVVAMALFLVAAVIAVGWSDDLETLALFALLLPAVAVNLRWMVLGVRGGRSVALGNMSAQALFMVGILLLVHGRGDAHDVPVLQAGAEVLYGAVVLVAVARRHGLPRPRIDVAGWRSTLSGSWPLFADGLARATVYWFDAFLIAVVLGRTEVGYYGAAYKPVLFLAGVIGLFSVAFLASYSSATPEQARELLRRALRVAPVATVPVAISTSLLAGVAVGTIYGDAYDPAVLVLAILVWRVPFLALIGPLQGILIASGLQRTMMRINLTGAAVNVAGNAVAIPAIGIEGAACVSIASELAILALSYRATRQRDLAPSVAAAVRRRLRGAPAG